MEKRSLHLFAIVLVIQLLSMNTPNCAVAQGEANQIILKGITPAQPPQTTIYVAKKIITMEKDNPEATAVAVLGKHIVAAGSLEQVKSALGNSSYIIDKTFAGKIILPGLIDQHLHPLLGALTLSTEVIANEDWVMPTRTFKAASSPKEYLSRLKSADSAMKNKSEWLFSWGYHSLWHGKLNRHILDSISSSRPIMIWQRSCHEFYLNSAAINALGLTDEMMKGKGEASKMVNLAEGHWWETGTNLVVGPLSKVFITPERFVFGLNQMIEYLHSKGVTAINEPGALVTPEILKLYQKVLGAEDVPFYSYFIVDGRGYVDKGVSAADAITDGEKIVNTYNTGKVSFFPKQIKLFADGAIISQLMKMKEPYLDAEGKPDPTHHGEWMITPDNLEIRTKAYWDAGYQIHIHVNGDEGLEVILGILEKRMAENPRANHRSVIVHFANSTEEQVGRIGRLGAIVSANAYYTVGFADKYSKFGLGPVRANSMVRSGSVVKHHIPLSFHSDLPMAPADPLFFAWCAVNRITPSGKTADPDQRISVDDALRAITIESAYSWQKENELGSIAPGKTANFTILEKDPYEVEHIKLKDIPIWGTVFEGRLFPITRRNSLGMNGNEKNSTLGSSLPLPSCFTPGEHVHDSDHGYCGACSFNLLLRNSGVLDNLVFSGVKP